LILVIIQIKFINHILMKIAKPRCRNRYHDGEWRTKKI